MSKFKVLRKKAYDLAKKQAEELDYTYDQKWESRPELDVIKLYEQMVEQTTPEGADEDEQLIHCGYCYAVVDSLDLEEIVDEEERDYWDRVDERQTKEREWKLSRGVR